MYLVTSEKYADFKQSIYYLLIANIGDSIVILWMLAVLFSGTQKMTKINAQTRDTNKENGPGKTKNLHFVVILGATLHNKSIGKEWQEPGKNALYFRQQAKDSLTKLVR